MESKQVSIFDQEALIRDGAKGLVQAILDKLPQEMSERDRARCEEMMLKMLLEGKNGMEAIGFSSEMVEHMYAYGYRLYNNGNYKNAKKVFMGLTMLHPDDARFYLAQAACHQHLKEWDQAIAVYNTSSILDPISPMPLFYMYECLNQLKAYEDAASCLKETMKRCGDEPLFASVKERCQLLLEALPKEK